MVTKKEREARARIDEEWESFCEYAQGTLERREKGRALTEADVEQLFERLCGDVLGYEPWQIGRQQDFADRTLEGQGVKLAVAEVKQYGAFESEGALADALRQAARYADRHRVPTILAFDGSTAVLALRRRERDDIAVCLSLELDPEADDPPDDLFYFTHFGLFRYPQREETVVAYDAADDEELHRTHHGEQLHYSCYAYVGDLRSKTTWKLPYRNPDGSPDEKRVGHAVNYLLSPGGYRGNLADDADHIDEGGRLMAALKLADAYRELGRWEADREGFFDDEKPTPVQLLWRYLHQNGVAGGAANRA